jgi:hypothetical protein
MQVLINQILAALTKSCKMGLQTNPVAINKAVPNKCYKLLLMLY